MTFLIASLVATAPLAPPEGYRLVWADEFSGSGPPDRRKWEWDADFNRRIRV